MIDLVDVATYYPSQKTLFIALDKADQFQYILKPEMNSAPLKTLWGMCTSTAFYNDHQRVIVCKRFTLQKRMCFTLHESHHFNDTCLVVSLFLMHQSTPNLVDSGEVQHGFAFHVSMSQKRRNVTNGIVIKVIQAPSQATSHAIQS